MTTALWQDKAFKHQWATLSDVLRRAELEAGPATHEAFGDLSEELCLECNESSQIWASAGEAVQTFLETCVEEGRLDSVPEDAEGTRDAIAALREGDSTVARDLVELLEVRGLALDAFAHAKAAVLAEIADHLDLEQLVWAVAYEAGLTDGESQETKTLSLDARCLLLALSRIGLGRIRQLEWILDDSVWPQNQHRRSLADGHGGMSNYVRARVAEDVLVPAANDRNHPPAVRAVCALALLAICPSEKQVFRRLAGSMHIRDLGEEANLGALGAEIWERRGNLIHGSRGDDFGEWLERTFSRVKYAVEALGPVVLPREAPEAPPPDRRHEPRVDTLNMVNVARFNEVGLLTDLEVGRTLDLSRDGMRLEVHHHVPIRSVLGLTLALGDQLLEVQGEVRSLEVLDEHLYALGIHFLDLPRESWGAIDSYLRRRRF